MNEYIMINHGKGTSEQWDEFFEMLQKGDHLLGGAPLDHGIAAYAGNFSGAKTVTITGYIVIQAESLEKAKEIVLKSPVHQSGGTVELFTLV